MVWALALYLTDKSSRNVMFVVLRIDSISSWEPVVFFFGFSLPLAISMVSVQHPRQQHNHFNGAQHNFKFPVHTAQQQVIISINMMITVAVLTIMVIFLWVTHPNILHGVHPNILQEVHPNILQGVYPNILLGVHPNILQGVYPNILQGVHPNILQGVHLIMKLRVNPNILQGVHPFILQVV